MTTPRYGIARVLSKRGVCSRTEAARRVQEGRVQVNGRVVTNPECPCQPERDRILMDGQPLASLAKVYLALNKPRGLVTTTSDEKGRATVYSLLSESGLGWLAPVGRLDKASEGLLLFSNDPAWAAGITDPERGPEKTYHVQIDALPSDELIAHLLRGVHEEGEFLKATSVSVLRQGQRNAWLEVTLDEGRNRHIRRLLGAFDIAVLRLVRVAIGEVSLDKWRW